MSDPCTLFGENPCTVCEPRALATPLSLVNRPGLSTLFYRCGTFATFRAAMLDHIASQRVISVDPNNASASSHLLTSGASDDYAIAMLELWAYVCDVLTMYQQGYANESFLRTGTLPASLQRIGALIGYAPARGIAASAVLAFVADTGAALTLPAGLQLQSVPAPGGTAQVFETTAKLPIAAAANTLTLVGPPRAGTFATGAQLLSGNAATAPLGAKLVFRFNAKPGTVAEDVIIATAPTRLGTAVTWRGNLNGVDAITVAAARYGRKFRWFGGNAPPQYLSGTPNSTDSSQIDWTTNTTSYEVPAQSAGSAQLQLDSVYEGIGSGARILVISDYALTTVLTVTGSAQGAASVGQITAATSILSVAEAVPHICDLRSVSMYELLGPDIPFLTMNYPDAVAVSDVEAGATIYVTDASALHKGTYLLLVQPTAAGLQSDLVQLSHEPSLTGTAPYALAITPAITNDYVPSQTTIYANVGSATVGQTQNLQVLGSGDATQSWQEFALGVKPVTYIPDAGADSGSSSTLQVLVDSIAWKEVPSFYGRAPDEAIFTTREDESGTTYVKFGDGITGRRLTTGSGNVQAMLRKGLGSDGNVDPKSIVTIMQQFPGLKAVTNPLAAYGGTDADAANDIRAKAPVTLATLGRAVSLRDYEALSLTYPGVAKASATWADFSSRRGVTLTVAAAGGKPMGALAAALRVFLDQHRDPNVPLAIGAAAKVVFEFSASVGVQAAYRQSVVGAAAAAALGPNGDGSGFLDFERMPIGRTIFQSELMTVLQNVAGVEYVTLNDFSAFDPAHAYGSDPTQIDALYVAPTEIAWPSVSGDESTASVSLSFVGGIADPGGGP